MSSLSVIMILIQVFIMPLHIGRFVSVPLHIETIHYTFAKIFFLGHFFYHNIPLDKNFSLVRTHILIVHSFICSFNKYVLSVYCVLGTLLGTENTTTNKTDKRKPVLS